MDIIKINGKAFSGAIVSYKGKMIDVDGDGTGETENGVTIRDIRRRGKSKIMLKLDKLTQEEFSAIMTALKLDRIEVEFFCGYYQTMTAYSGDKNWELIKAKDEKDSRWRLEVSLIEY
ncbi:MAG: hypothetical protein K2J80_08835 [Oscillospiraceae bacterium]|nr:hypothetical protein [Oscillospiraceae bacterium]